MIRPLALLAVGAATLSAQTPKTWTATEELRIGGDTGPYMFEEVEGIVPTKGGNIFVLDWKAREIRVFDSVGKFVRLAARRGRGPGEIENANGLVVAPDGNVWTNDPNNARYSIYGPDGKFLRQVLNRPYGWENPWRATMDDRGRLIERIARPAGDYVTRAYRWLDVDGHSDTLKSPTCPIRHKAQRPFLGMNADGAPAYYRAVPFQPLVDDVHDRRGTRWCTSGDQYVIYNQDLQTGDTLVVIRSASPHPGVSAEERRAIIAEIDSALAKFPKRDADYSRIPETKPPINGIFVDDVNRLWVLKPGASARTSEFDVWDTTGKQLAMIQLPFRVKLDKLPPLVVGDMMYALTFDDDGVQSVVRARIRR